MATVLIEPETFEASSPTISVPDSSGVAISLYTPDGTAIPYGVVFYLERLTVAGIFQPVKTVDYGQVVLKHDVNVVLITTPGTYRVYRPDITNFGVPVGLQLG